MLTFFYPCVAYVYPGSDAFTFRYNTKLNMDNVSSEIDVSQEFLSLLPSETLQEQYLCFIGKLSIVVLVVPIFLLFLRSFFKQQKLI